MTLRHFRDDGEQDAMAPGQQYDERKWLQLTMGNRHCRDEGEAVISDLPPYLDAAIRQLGALPKESVVVMVIRKPVDRDERGWTPSRPNEEPPF